MSVDLAMLCAWQMDMKYVYYATCQRPDLLNAAGLDELISDAMAMQFVRHLDVRVDEEVRIKWAKEIQRRLRIVQVDNQFRIEEFDPESGDRVADFAELFPSLEECGEALILFSDELSRRYDYIEMRLMFIFIKSSSE